MKRKIIPLLSLIAMLFSFIPAANTHAATWHPCDDWMNSGLNTGLSTELNEELFNEDVPLCTTTNSGMHILNGKLLQDRGMIVYGDHTDVPGNDSKKYDGTTGKVYNDALPLGLGPKKGDVEWRYLGVTESGGKFPNPFFPADDLVTTDMSVRQWLTDKPWTHSKQIRNSNKPEQPSWLDWYPDAALKKYLSTIIDPYVADGSPGNFAKLNDSTNRSWTDMLFNAAVWSQAPTQRGPGVVTMWSKSKSKDWYETFLTKPLNGELVLANDVAINPNHAVLDDIDGQKFMDLEIYSNYNESLHGIPIYYRWAIQKDGTGTWDMKVLSCNIPTIMGTDEGANINKRFYPPNEKVQELGVSGYYVKTRIKVPLLDIPKGDPVPQGKADKPVPMGTCVEVTDYSDYVDVAGKTTQSKLASDVMENVSATASSTTPQFELMARETAGGISPEAEAAIKEAAAQYSNPVEWSTIKQQRMYFVANVNPNKNSPKNEAWYGNNKALWPTDRITVGFTNIFKTPPIDFKNITTNEGIAYWKDIKSPELDKYVLKCSPSYAVNYSGKLTEKNLTGLQPNTKYTCNLEAFNKKGVSGGVTTNSFTTKPLGGVSGNGYWDDKGLIRQVDSLKQGENALPKTALDYSKYAANQVKAAANKYSPFFGEKIGVWGDPAGRTSTYSWQFTYKELVCGEDSCSWVDFTATDSCQIDYVAIGPEGWRNITTNPTGMTMKVTNGWNSDTTDLKVVGATTKSCIGSDPRNTTPFQFNYYVPTTYASPAGAMIMDTGFDSTKNEIDPKYENLQVSIFANAYSLGSDGRSLSGTNTKTPIAFKQMWSIFTALGTGN